MTPSQYRQAINKYNSAAKKFNSEQKRKIDDYNRKAKKHNDDVNRSIDNYNREVRKYNAAQRARKQKLNSAITNFVTKGEENSIESANEEVNANIVSMSFNKKSEINE